MISRLLEQETAQAVLRATPELDPDTVTPGVIGFVVTFLVAAAVVLLAIDMTRRIRRTRYRSEIGERLDLERSDLERLDHQRAEAERSEAEGINVDKGTGDSDSPGIDTGDPRHPDSDPDAFPHDGERLPR